MKLSGLAGGPGAVAVGGQNVEDLRQFGGQEVEVVGSGEGQMSKVSALPSAGAGRAVITASAVIRRRISWCPELLGQFQTLPLIV